MYDSWFAVIQSCRTAEQQKDQKKLLDELKSTTMNVETTRNITCHEDEEVTLIKFCKQPSFIKAANPFVDQTPRPILTRQYLIQVLTINPGFTATSFNFPSLLFDIPTIANVLASFSLFRSDLKIMLKLSAIPYQAGLLLVSFVHDTSLTYSEQSLMALSSYNPVTLNISTQDTVELQYNWMSGTTYGELDTASIGTQIGQLTIAPIIPIRNTSGGTTTAYLELYAQFVNPHCAGYVTNLSQRKKKRTQKKMKEVISQSMATPPSGQLEGQTPEQSQKSDDDSAVLQFIRKVKAIYHEIIPSPTDIKNALHEAKEIVKEGLELGSMVPGAMDKPRSTKLSMKMVNVEGSDLAQGTGLDQTLRCSLYQTSKLAIPPVDKTCPSTMHTVAQIAQIPMLHTYATFTVPGYLDIGATPYFMGSFNIPSTNVVQPDYLMLIASLHQMWRGSIKYFLQFVTDSYTIARFRISYVYIGDVPSSEGGDFPQRIVEIKGATEVELLVPYLSPTPWTQNTAYYPSQEGYNLNLLPKVRIELLDPPVGLDTAVIDVVVWRAAGEDIQFQAVTSCAYGLELREVESQCSILDRFTKQFTPITCGCTMSYESGYTSTEITGRVEDILRRYWRVSAPDVLFHPGTQAGNQYLPQVLLTSLFRYQRGSTRARFLVPVAATVPIYSTLKDSPLVDYGRGLITARPGDWLMIEIPWYQVVPYLDTNSESSALLEVAIGNTTTIDFTSADTLQSVGDDFYMFYLRPPLPITNPIKNKTSSNTGLKEKRVHQSNDG